MSTSVRIIVADDHSLFRAGLIELLRTVAGFEVEGEAGSGDDAIVLAGQLRPDVAIIDVGMPGPEPAETVRAIRSISPPTGVVIVTMFDDPALVHELIQAGAAAYLLKSADRTELATAVRAAKRSDGTVLVGISRESFVGLKRPPQSAPRLLSPRETAVLQLLAEAQSNRDIATALHVSNATVKRHLTDIYRKLDARSRVDALRIARHIGLVAD